MNLVIRNARKSKQPDTDKYSDIYIEDNCISAIGSKPEGFVADEEIDAANHLLLPGLIDCQCRLRDPGQPEKANIQSETEAAVKGGITSLLLPPDTIPVIDNSATVELIHHRNETFGFHAKVYPIGALTRNLDGEHLSNMGSLKVDGCVAMSNANQPLANNLVQRRAMEYAAGQNLLVIIQAVDRDLQGNGCAHEGAIATRLGLPAIPESAETAALAKDIELVAQTGARTHFGQISCARSVDMIRRAKAKGLPVTADCAIHQLFLTDHDIGNFDSNKHTLPPLRGQADRDALREGVSDGTIDCLCSDHQPHEIDAKLRPFPSSEPGISGLDTFLSLGLRLIDDGVIDTPRLIAAMSTNPAQIFGVEGGEISEGAIADLILIDIDEDWRCDSSKFISKGRNTAFDGWHLCGRVSRTIINGNCVYSR